MFKKIGRCYLKMIKNGIEEFYKDLEKRLEFLSVS